MALCVVSRCKNRGEWRGIVDDLAIRKNTSIPANVDLKRGDLFDLILIQMKGGSARPPSMAEKLRLQAVAEHYGARGVVLFEWKKGKSTKFCALSNALEWRASTSTEIFG